MSKRFNVLGAAVSAVSAALLVACLAPDVPRGPHVTAAGPRSGQRSDLAMSVPLTAGLMTSLLPLPTVPTRAADRVFVISIDGLRPDALTDETTPVLARLGREGATARHGHTIDRSSTLPSHASMLSGVDVATHGLDWNAWRPTRGRIRFPSIFHVARAGGLETSMVVAKQKLLHLVDESDGGMFQAAGLVCRRVNRVALPELREAAPGIHFVHYGDVDSAGHAHGWMSHAYLAAVRDVDRCVGEIVEGLLARGDVERTLVVITSDHGGHGHQHGTSEPVDTAIPWIAWGGPVRTQADIGEVDTRDTAATALAALGLPLPLGIEGRLVENVLR